MKTKRFHWLSFSIVLMLIVGIFAVREAQAHPTPTPGVSPTPETNNLVSEKTPEPDPLVTDFANYHPLIVHFPIVLLIFAVVFQILSFFVYRKELSFTVVIIILTGTVSVWLASNVYHAHPAGLSPRASEMFETHELMAQYTFWLSLGALFAKSISHFFAGRKWWSESTVLVLLLAASITVSIAGHHGAQLVHIEGVGPQGKFLEHQH